MSIRQETNWIRWWLWPATILLIGSILPCGAGGEQVALRPIGSYQHGRPGRQGSEIACHDPGRQRLFVTNGGEERVDVLDIADPTQPRLITSLRTTLFGAAPTSVAYRDGLLAVAIPAVDRTAAGCIALFDADLQLVESVTVGSLPDMVTFTPDGLTLLVANEGEPNDEYDRDPEGSLTVVRIDRQQRALGKSIATAVIQVGFDALGQVPAAKGAARIFGPQARPAQDLEPEYIAVSSAGKYAWVTLQENNAMARLDLRTIRIDRLTSLGLKDFAATGVGLDADDGDGRISWVKAPVWGMFQPDGIACFDVEGEVYLFTANEGDHRSYSGFDEVTRVADWIGNEPTEFGLSPENARSLKSLRVTRYPPEDADTLGQRRLVTFGARSFAVWNMDMQLVYDSGSLLEECTAQAIPDLFNSEGTQETMDQRSPFKGPEPEGVAIGQVGGKRLGFVGLERPGAIIVVDLTNPHAPEILSLYHGSQFPETGATTDRAPEGLTFIPTADSPTGKPLLVVCFEVSGTTRILEVGHGA